MTSDILTEFMLSVPDKPPIRGFTELPIPILSSIGGTIEKHLLSGVVSKSDSLSSLDKEEQSEAQSGC